MQKLYQQVYLLKTTTHTKTPHRFLDEEFILNIEFYFNISPASYTLCWGYGINILLCALNRQSELSEFREVGNYCVSNKVPRLDWNLWSRDGSGSYFLSAIAACAAASLAMGTRNGEQET